MNHKYFDKNGVEITAGMHVLIYEDSDRKHVEEVCACGDGDLGVDAVNPSFRLRHPDTDNCYYSLSMFGSLQLEVVDITEGDF